MHYLKRQRSRKNHLYEKTSSSIVASRKMGEKKMSVEKKNQKQKRVLEPNAIVFDKTWESPLSPNRFSRFKFGNQPFHSVTQFVEYKKANHFNKPEIAEEILQAKHPYGCLNLLDNIDDTKWAKNALKYAKIAVNKKFTVIPGYAKYLLATGNRPIYYNSENLFWGVSPANGEDNDWDNRNLKKGKIEVTGENQMGKIIMDLRSQLRSELQAAKVMKRRAAAQSNKIKEKQNNSNSETEEEEEKIESDNDEDDDNDDGGSSSSSGATGNRGEESGGDDDDDDDDDNEYESQPPPAKKKKNRKKVDFALPSKKQKR